MAEPAQATTDRAGDGDAPVTVASYATPPEAELARALLASEEIAAFLLHDHGQYVSGASWVQLQVARRDRELATKLLEDGPLPAHGALRVGGEDERDDMRSMRLRRRFVIARWFLYAVGLGEVVLGVGLLVPRTLRWAALGLIPIMAGAVVSHAMHDPLDAALPAGGLVLVLAYLVWRTSGLRAQEDGGED